MFLWAQCVHVENISRDTDQQGLMKIKPSYGLTALSLSVCSGPCLSLAPGRPMIAANSTMASEVLGCLASSDRSVLCFSLLLAFSVFSRSWIVNQHLLPATMTIFDFIFTLIFWALDHTVFFDLKNYTQRHNHFPNVLNRSVALTFRL